MIVSARAGNTCALEVASSQSSLGGILSHLHRRACPGTLPGGPSTANVRRPGSVCRAQGCSPWIKESERQWGTELIARKRCQSLAKKNVHESLLICKEPCTNVNTIILSSSVLLCGWEPSRIHDTWPKPLVSSPELGCGLLDFILPLTSCVQFSSFVWASDFSWLDIYQF